MAGKEAAEWLEGLEMFGIKPGLENITELLSRLGNPQEAYRKVHVAGSDGKGSTCAMIASVLRESGVRTGLYTSPHILQINERISVDGEDISDSEMNILTRVIRPVVEDMAKNGMQCTMFEVTTAMAFLHFKEKEVEYAVIEVGMGGRFDATNVIVPDVSVITNISVEHTEYLGNTVDRIAGEKAGIIKPGVPVITANTGTALNVIKDTAVKAGSELIQTSECTVTALNTDSTQIEYAGKGYTVGLAGAYQAANAALAIEAVSALPHPERFVPNIPSGLSSVRWPCRMQRIHEMPMIVDVTHTKAGSKILADSILKIYGKVTVVFGVLGDKDIDGILENLSRIAERMIVTVPTSGRAAPLGQVEELARKHCENVTAEGSVDRAISLGMRDRKDTIVLVTGSFIMAEDALRWLRKTSAGS